ncbi:MAG: isochorismatase family cysteine hydrolase [Aerococcus sp.]|nr:isochorismatase family cysteine hydrolase [Aerococcus sp.]
MDKALINIDYTNDFVASDGALTAGEPAQALEERIVALTKMFHDAGEFVAFTIDDHKKGDPYHPETALFPPHNLTGSHGQELYGELEEYYQAIKQDDNVYYTPKTRYSAFEGTTLDLKLRERGINEVHLVGVVTDICVLHTAIAAYNRGYRIVVHEDGVASFNPTGHAWALNHFKQALGAQVVTGYRL